MHQCPVPRSFHSRGGRTRDHVRDGARGPVHVRQDMHSRVLRGRARYCIREWGSGAGICIRGCCGGVRAVTVAFANEARSYGIAFAPSFFVDAAFATGGARRVLTDAHFVARDRMGRNLAFLARLAADGNVTVGGGACAYLVANDEATALAIHPGGLGAVLSDEPNTRGWSLAFVCRMCGAPAVCARGVPLSAGPFECARLDAFDGDLADFQAWSWSGVPCARRRAAHNFVMRSRVGTPFDICVSRMRLTGVHTHTRMRFPCEPPIQRMHFLCGPPIRRMHFLCGPPIRHMHFPCGHSSVTCAPPCAGTTSASWGARFTASRMGPPRRRRLGASAD